MLLWLKYIQEHKDAVLLPYSTCLICVLVGLQRFYRFCVLIAAKFLDKFLIMWVIFLQTRHLYQISLHTRFWYLWHCWAAKAWVSAHISKLPRPFAAGIYKVWIQMVISVYLAKNIRKKKLLSWYIQDNLFICIVEMLPTYPTL